LRPPYGERGQGSGIRDQTTSANRRMKLRVREEIISHWGRRVVSFCWRGFALRFGSDLVVTIEQGRRNSTTISRTLRLRNGQRWPEDEMRKCEISFSRTLWQAVDKHSSAALHSSFVTAAYGVRLVPKNECALHLNDYQQPGYIAASAEQLLAASGPFPLLLTAKRSFPMLP